MKLLFLLASISNSANAGDIIMNYSQYDAHDNHWKMIPEIVICTSQTVFSKKQIEKALNTWSEKYSKITFREKCNYKPTGNNLNQTNGVTLSTFTQKKKSIIKLLEFMNLH